MKAVLLALLNQLATATTLANDTVYGKYVRMWNNQIAQCYDEKGQRVESFPMPAAFLEITTGEIKQLGDGSQHYDPLMITVHLLHWQLDAGDGTFEQNLDVFGIKDEIYTVLQDFVPTVTGFGFSRLWRVSEKQDYDHPGVYHHITTFQSSMLDFTKQVPYQGIDSSPVPMPLELQLSIPTSADPNDPYIQVPNP